MRDLRDPEKLGKVYLWLRGAGVSIEESIKPQAKNYENGKYISCDPADHHSKTRQDIESGWVGE